MSYPELLAMCEQVSLTISDEQTKLQPVSRAKAQPSFISEPEE